MHVKNIAHRDRQVPSRFLSLAYRVPDPVETKREYDRYVHADLASMTLQELRQELERLKLRFLFDDQPHPWFHQREVAVRTALCLGRTQR
jgi:hypothetical protein